VHSVSSGRKGCQNHRIGRARSKRVIDRDCGCARSATHKDTVEFASLAFDLRGGCDGGVVRHGGSLC